jgi:hypothetical protein
MQHIAINSINENLRLIFQELIHKSKIENTNNLHGIPIDCNIFSMALQRFEVMNNAYLGILFLERIKQPS